MKSWIKKNESELCIKLSLEKLFIQTFQPSDNFHCPLLFPKVLLHVLSYFILNFIDAKLVHLSWENLVSIWNATIGWNGSNHAHLISSVIKQKNESQNEGNKKTKYAKFFEKNEHFLPHDTHTYVCLSQGKKC